MLFNLAKCMVLFLMCNLRKLCFISAPDNNFSEMFLRKNGVWKLLWLSLDDAKGESAGERTSMISFPKHQHNPKNFFGTN